MFWEPQNASLHHEGGDFLLPTVAEIVILYLIVDTVIRAGPDILHGILVGYDEVVCIARLQACSGFFSPFPHGTGSLSVSYEYLALPDGPGGFTQDYSCPALLRSPLRFGLLRVRGCHPLWRGFPVASTHGLSCDGAVLQPRRCRDNVGLGCSPVARHYWGNHSLFSFPAGTKMFQFPAFASRIGGIISLQDIGLSHSEIRGSRAICASPRLFAAYHVLHRL